MVWLALTEQRLKHRVSEHKAVEMFLEAVQAVFAASKFIEGGHGVDAIYEWRAESFGDVKSARNS
jgi:hypothetical protein